ncbi:MAG TPA: GAF and ANTAR domain-containing protein, partial [Microlunatus sp.]|nr:GAF and ANTAR domain-containing protein [Microlunatus sp.]
MARPTFDSEGTARIEELSTSVHQADTVDETVEAVTELALQALGASSATILLGRRPDELEVAAATDGAIAELAAHGAASRHVRDAFTRSSITVSNLADEVGEPAPAVHSLIAVRLLIGDRPAGVLVVGHPEPDAFGPHEESVAYIVSRHASIAVAKARHQESLAEAVDARKLVGQAMGILMERYDLDSDQAFAVLARYSQHTNTKLRTIALHLVQTRTLPAYDSDGR